MNIVTTYAAAFLSLNAGSANAWPNGDTLESQLFYQPPAHATSDYVQQQPTDIGSILQKFILKKYEKRTFDFKSLDNYSPKQINKCREDPSGIWILFATATKKNDGSLVFLLYNYTCEERDPKYVVILDTDRERNETKATVHEHLIESFDEADFKKLLLRIIGGVNT